MLSFLTSLVFPNHCLLCEDLLRPEEQSVCQICLAAQPRCSFLERQRLERISSTVEAHFSAVLINCPSVSTLCHNLKYGGHPRTARHLGYHFLGPAIASAHKDIVLVPMPVSKQRRRRRGYNQSEGLAQGCLRKLTESGYRATVALLLEKHAHRKSQIEVDPFERWTNPRGSLRVRQKKAAHPAGCAACAYRRHGDYRVDVTLCCRGRSGSVPRAALAFARTSLRGLVANNNGFLYYASVRCNLDEISARRSCTQIIRFA